MCRPRSVRVSGTRGQSSAKLGAVRARCSLRWVCLGTMVGASSKDTCWGGVGLLRRIPRWLRRSLGAFHAGVDVEAKERRRPPWPPPRRRRRCRSTTRPVAGSGGGLGLGLAKLGQRRTLGPPAVPDASVPDSAGQNLHRPARGLKFRRIEHVARYRISMVVRVRAMCGRVRPHVAPPHCVVWTSAPSFRLMCGGPAMRFPQVSLSPADSSGPGRWTYSPKGTLGFDRAWAWLDPRCGGSGQLQGGFGQIWTRPQVVSGTSTVTQHALGGRHSPSLRGSPKFRAKGRAEGQPILAQGLGTGPWHREGAR